MPIDLNKLSRAALSAAMKGGTDGWGKHGSAAGHVRYLEPAPSTSRRRCHCGCNQRATHRGMANGVCLLMRCELEIRRWVKDWWRTGNERQSMTKTHQLPPFVPETDAQLLKRVARLRKFPTNTCQASRHAQIIGEALIKKRPYPMLSDDPQHCGGAILSTVASLYAARTRIAQLEAERGNQ